MSEDIIMQQDGFLRRADAFTRLTPEQDRLFSVRCEVFHVPAGVLLNEGKNNEKSAFFSLTGYLRAMASLVPGKEVYIDTFPSGLLLGALASIDTERHVLRVMTETDAQVVRVPQDVLLDILAANHDVCLQILQMMAVRLHLTATHLCELSNLDVRHRLYNALLRLSRMDPANPRVRLICPPLTHTDLADHVGARRETVSREMSRLIQSNIIEKTSRAITIRQPYELTRLMAQVFKT